MNPRDLPDDDEPGFLRRNLGMIIFGLLALGGGGYYFATAKPSKASAPKKKLDMVMIMPVMPPPPPPPPPPPKQEEPPPPEEKEEEVAAEEEPPPDADKPADKPADEPIGTALTGGDGSSGLGAGGGIGGMGIGGSGNGRGYSERGRWQGKFGRSVQEILSRHAGLKFAKGSVPFRVWLDDSGRITRVVLNGSTGNSEHDDMLKNRALVGQVLEPAPPGTPMPVIMRFYGR